MELHLVSQAITNAFAGFGDELTKAFEEFKASPAWQALIKAGEEYERGYINEPTEPYFDERFDAAVYVTEWAKARKAKEE